MLSADDQDLIAAYTKAPNELKQAIADLSDSDMDQTRSPGKWSIREIVHHVIDCDLNYFQINRYALADTGATFMFNEFDGNVWSTKMDYHNRSVEFEMKVFAMMREYIAYLCTTLPNSLDRVLVHEHGKATVRDALKHDIQHTSHHIKQIIETRKVHNI